MREIAASRPATGNVPSIARPEGVAMTSEQRNDTGDEASSLRHARSGVFRLLEGGWEDLRWLWHWQLQPLRIRLSRQVA